MKKFTIFFLSCILLVLFAFAGAGCSGCSSCSEKGEISTYEIECEYHDGRLKGVQTFTFYNTFETSVSTLKFNLFGNAFRKDAKYSPILPQHNSLAYPNGASYGDMQINGCSQEGKSLTFEICGQDQNILELCLLEEIFPGESVCVQIDFTLNLANVVARTGINSKTVNLGNFYPILCGYDNGFYECVYYGVGDPFFSDVADYKVSITLPSEYVVATSGKQESVTQNGSQKTVVSTIENARSFAIVLSKEFHTISLVSDGTEIIYYYYDDQDPSLSLKYAVDALKLFNEKFGKYPYETYSVVQTAFVQGGMEYPALTYISDNITGTAYGEVIVHETAHQWWQTVVGNNEIEYGFLDEGLAEYSVVLFFENYTDYGVNAKALVQSAEQTYKVFCSVVDRLEGKVNSAMLRSLKDFTSEYEYVNIAYIKPCIMYDTLRKTVGDEKFFKGLKRYYEEYAFKNARPYDIVGIYEKLGADTNGFFESFYNGSAIL